MVPDQDPSVHALQPSGHTNNKECCGTCFDCLLVSIPGRCANLSIKVAPCAGMAMPVLHTGHTLQVPRTQPRATPLCLRQAQACHSSLHSRQATRRQQLLSSAALLANTQLPWPHVAKASATAIYHEVSISSISSELTVVDEGAEPFEDPPTYVTATGRIVASECRPGRVGGSGALLLSLLSRRLCCWQLLLAWTRGSALQLSASRIKKSLCPACLPACSR